jgi:hypothetical protein
MGMLDMRHLPRPRSSPVMQKRPHVQCSTKKINKTSVCDICGPQNMDETAHINTTHQRNLTISQSERISGNIFYSTEVRAIMGKNDDWATSNQVSKAATCQRIGSSSDLERLKSTSKRLRNATITSLCTLQERVMAAALIEVSFSGIPETHFTRISKDDSPQGQQGWKFCNQEQLCLAQDHQSQDKRHWH